MDHQDHLSRGGELLLAVGEADGHLLQLELLTLCNMQMVIMTTMTTMTSKYHFDVGIEDNPPLSLSIVSSSTTRPTICFTSLLLDHESTTLVMMMMHMMLISMMMLTIVVMIEVGLLVDNEHCTGQWS